MASLPGRGGLVLPVLLLSLGCYHTPEMGLGPLAPPPERPNRLELPAAKAAEVSVVTAETMARNGQFADAAAYYELARQKDPRVKVSRQLAVLYDLQGEFAKASREYDKALEQTPNDPDLLNDIGYSYFLRGQYDKAVDYLHKIVNRYPENKRALVNLGLALAQQGHYEDGYQTFLKALPPGEACCNLAFVYQNQGKHDEAKATYRKALGHDPSLKLAQIALMKYEYVEKHGTEPAAQKGPAAGPVPGGGVSQYKPVASRSSKVDGQRSQGFATESSRQAPAKVPQLSVTSSGGRVPVASTNPGLLPQIPPAPELPYPAVPPIESLDQPFVPEFPESFNR